MIHQFLSKEIYVKSKPKLHYHIIHTKRSINECQPNITTIVTLSKLLSSSEHLRKILIESTYETITKYI